MKKYLSTLAIALALTACGKVTLENYKKVNIGMDKAEIEQLLGTADKCEEKTLHTNCIWGSEDKNITVTLVADKVTLYSEKGL
ncbi:DUF3862 domain-containing protein [Pseudoalteromonas denitrificans]|uniref:Beta-lactamase inhibitor (BLIP) n=1 Tax=Pseudoalteromonas denitrificans DSM 6059 TaxID=1123010 RepID=A0A1I1P888_9GAMM|nr:DUF3862 domain-containing protein [Pseudoalteromonas denitrificans]SFD05935.1 hypothetical protein SAMN02745724_03341 [Pseudoalteromonas denitrificans DSM 6059]